MVVLKYGKAKLVFVAVGTLAFIILYIGLLLDPPSDLHRHGTVSFLAHTPRLAPMIIGALLVVIWRAATLAIGDTAALEATPTQIVLTTYWGTRTVPWRTITQIAGETVRSRYGRYDYLVVRTIDGQHKLPLGSTDMVMGGLDALVDTVEGLRCGALRGAPGAQPGPAPVPLGANAATFDAEAVMARYLATKAAESDAPLGARPAPANAGAGAPLSLPAQPPRAAFGRKGL